MPDALVIGGGLIGLLCARELHRAGMRVTVVDRNQPGREASWASAGIVTPRVPSSRTGGALLNNLSVERWPSLATELREETGLDVEYRENGVFVPAFSDEDSRRLRGEVPLLRAAGVAADFVDGQAMRDAEPALGPSVVGGQILPGGNVENRRATRAAELALGRAGVEVRSGVLVTAIASRGGRVSGVYTETGEIGADVVVLAAGSWSGRLPGADPPVAVVPQRGQILALQAPGRLRRVILKEDDPYLVPRVDGRVIVGATREFAGYDRTYTAGGVAWLLTSAIEMVPDFAGAPIAEIWTGFRPVSADGLPIIGRADVEGLFYATGHGPSGIGPAPGTAALLAALVLGQPPPIPPEPFRPQRFAER